MHQYAMKSAYPSCYIEDPLLSEFLIPCLSILDEHVLKYKWWKVKRDKETWLI